MMKKTGTKGTKGTPKRQMSKKEFYTQQRLNAIKDGDEKTSAAIFKKLQGKRTGDALKDINQETYARKQFGKGLPVNDGSDMFPKRSAARKGMGGHRGK